MSILRCLQIKTATISSKSGGHLHSHHPLFTSNKNLCLTRLGRFRASGSFLSFLYNPYGRLVYRMSFGSLVLCKARQAFDAVLSVTDCSWNELVVASDNLVLVLFWGEPCPMMEPTVKELANEYAVRVECYKMNTVDYPNIPKQLGINSTPMMLLFKDGEMKDSIIGDVPKSILKETIGKHLSR